MLSREDSHGTDTLPTATTKTTLEAEVFKPLLVYTTNYVINIFIEYSSVADVIYRNMSTL